MPTEAQRSPLQAALQQVEALVPADAEPPPSTYRLQLSAAFGFDAARAVLPYLRSLGVGALYLSPILAARSGSTHGYDVVDFERISSELGGEAAFAALAAAAREAGLSVIVDFVPNHMGASAENPWWWDLLENGPASVHADTFDVDWRPLKAELIDRVLLPILGDQYGVVLERGELVLAREGGAFVLRYLESRLPIAPRSVPRILRHGLDELALALGADHVHLQELQSICASLDKLGPRTPDAGTVAERAREKEVAKRRLAALCEASPEVARFVDRNVAAYRGLPGAPRTFDRLHALLEEQAYRLAHWRVAGQEINYRRFFDVNDLAAVRMESWRVFRAAHRVVLGLASAGQVQGLRIDHPDGLYDPTGYFARLQASVLSTRARQRAEAAGEPCDDETAANLTEELARALQDGSLRARPLFLVAEKILARGERMPDSWAVHGSTGYDFLNEVNGLFVDPGGGAYLEGLRRRLGGQRTDFQAEAAASKRLVMRTLMASELQVLGHRLNRASETNRRTRDFTVSDLRSALVELVAHFPVYRTYVSPKGEVPVRDAGIIETALARARRDTPLLDPSIFDFLREVTLLRFPEELSAAERADWLEFMLRLQQLTGAVTAKAVEDTTFYRHVRLASLNEVGGDPGQFGVAPEHFHARNAERLQRWSGSLLATSTHDTKRAEDVRTRIDALSEIPAEWAERVRGWQRLTRRFSRRLEREPAPDRTDELLLYQTLVGTWPEPAGPEAAGWDDYVARIRAYMQKAVREAKRHSSWTRVNAPYEEALAAFVDAALSSPVFVADLDPFARRLAEAGRLSSLSQTALKCVSPGVADVYQGAELWDQSLVDPDNRRPVDFAARAGLLQALDARRSAGPSDPAALARELSGTLADGRAKLLLLSTLLRLRRERPSIFLRGAYLPLTPLGEDAEHLVALARVHEEQSILCLAPRLVLRLLDRGRPVVWRARVALPPELQREWVDAITGAPRRGDTLDVGACLADFPVAVLTSGPWNGGA
jgi:(1->4)-alpha-D-glucan 1-alpha-D-glucosylmutase